MLEEYFRDLFKTMKLGDAREESYYSDLKKLFENWSEQNKKQILVTTLPKKTEAGNPDFRIWDGKVGGDLQLASFSPKLDFHQFTPLEVGEVEKRCKELRLEFREKVYKTETRGRAMVSRKEEKATKVVTPKQPVAHIVNK